MYFLEYYVVCDSASVQFAFLSDVRIIQVITFVHSRFFRLDMDTVLAGENHFICPTVLKIRLCRGRNH